MRTRRSLPSCALRGVVLVAAPLATLSASAVVGCSNSTAGSGGTLASCVTTYSGQADSCTVGAICSGTLYRADCEAQPDGGSCVCDVIDAGVSKTVPFSPSVCTPLGSSNDPTPNASAANGACGWGL